MTKKELVRLKSMSHYGRHYYDPKVKSARFPIGCHCNKKFSTTGLFWKHIFAVKKPRKRVKKQPEENVILTAVIPVVTLRRFVPSGTERVILQKWIPEKKVWKNIAKKTVQKLEQEHRMILWHGLVREAA